MKLYKNLVHSLALTLQEILIKKKYTDKALEKLFKQNPQWGSRDRRFVAEGIYDIVRHYRLYSTLAETENNFWFITAVWLVIKQIELPAWPEFKHVNPQYILKKREELRSNPRVNESYPDWLWEQGVNELGEQVWMEEAQAMNRVASVFLRANTLKTSREGLKQQLEKDGIECREVNGVSHALELAKRENIFQNRLFKEGWFEVQDAGSQLIAEFVAPKPGEFIVDACAGAGGKSLHLAALMNNKGRIVSMDVEEWKLEELKKRARRAGAFNLETRVISSPRVIESLEQKADRVLLDVPCSGLGVIKRNPDAKWKLSPEVLERTRQLQQKLFSDYSIMCKKGGWLIYSTCSILPCENRGQVDCFLSDHPNFSFVSEKTILPHSGFDGFYMALLQKSS